MGVHFNKFIIISSLLILCTLIVACGNDIKDPIIKKDVKSELDIETKSDITLPSEQEIAILKSEIKEVFAKKNEIDISMVPDPYLYDLNNDEIEEIVVSTAESYINLSEIFYLSIYDLKGNELDSLKDDSGNPISIHNIKNQTYGNCISVIHYGMGGYSANIMTLQNRELQSIATIGSSGDGEEVISDSNEDGYEEFSGLEFASGIGSDRLDRAAGFAEKVWYTWDMTEKEYLPQSLEGTSTEKIGTLDEELAKRILNAARQTQLSWMDPLTWDEVVTKLSPFYSNNFIYEYIQNGHTVYDDQTDKYTPLFLHTEDPGGILPELGEEPLNLLLSQDGNTVTILNEIIENREGFEVHTKVEIKFVKTGGGWKIDIVDAMHEVTEL